MMKIDYDYKDQNIVMKIYQDFILHLDPEYIALINSDECEPLYLFGDTMLYEMNIRKIGYKETAKAIFQGSHPYRDDCGKCPRCYRFRPEIHWNNENLNEKYLCNRCLENTKGEE